MRNRTTNISHWFSSYRYLFAAGMVLSLFSGQAQAFRIVSPADGTTLTSGRSVPVEVEAGREAGLVEVRYYWYPEQTDALVEQGADRMAPTSQGSISTEKYWQRDSITGAPVVALPALTSTVDRQPPLWRRLTYSLGRHRAHAPPGHRRYLTRPSRPKNCLR